MADTGKPMGMFLQDPSLPDLYGDVDVSGDVLEGNGSSRFCMRDEKFGLDSTFPTGPVTPALDWAGEDVSFGRFAASDPVDNPQFHQVNVFAVCTSALALVEQEMGGPIAWRGGGPLVVRPHAFEDFNAFYNPADVSLNFGYTPSPYRRTPIYTCLSHDIVVHELGHAVLDHVRPRLSFFSPDAGALHESFGDLLQLFAALQHEPVARRVFADSGGDLSRPSALSRMGEELGIGLFGTGFPYGRSALDRVAYGPDAPWEFHDRSVIWTGAVYELMTRLATARMPEPEPDFDTFVTAVREAAKWTRGMLFRVLNYLPLGWPSLPQVARLVVEADARVFGDDAEFRDIAREVFVKRGLWDKGLDLSAPDIGATFAGLADGNPVTLTQAVMAHADELSIPRGIGARILAPSMVTTTRRVDRVGDGYGNREVRLITEHYLTYGYELAVPMPMVISESDPEPVETLFPVQFGGTLVLDEDWNAGVLAIDVLPTAPEPGPGPGPLTSVLGRALAEVATRSRTRGGRPHRCDLREHLRGVHGPPSPFPYAPGR